MALAAGRVAGGLRVDRDWRASSVGADGAQQERGPAGVRPSSKHGGRRSSRRWGGGHQWQEHCRSSKARRCTSILRGGIDTAVQIKAPAAQNRYSTRQNGRGKRSPRSSSAARRRSEAEQGPQRAVAEQREAAHGGAGSPTTWPLHKARGGAARCGEQQQAARCGEQRQAARAGARGEQRPAASGRGEEEQRKNMKMTT
ncbi:hypothetical protein GQ55_4G193700 [Panicum hallii var. hallii]|uniref:Uncharacterized protein n=1 Tax=Panicum hallii var. hallii TaxID=1504633 RepID=A0A2T7DZ09_9POAL|nr:hypothetical protein GQ55_4G193700 [Panicum hallii var. hallii]